MKTEVWNELFAHHQCQCVDFVDFGGITLARTSVRRKPNAFNLLHQMRLMGKLGGHVSIEARLSQPLCQLVFFHAQEWNSSNKVMAATQVGPREATSAYYLLHCIDDDTVHSLTEAVKCQPQFKKQYV